MIVVADASAFGDLIVQRRDAPLFRLLQTGADIHVPTLCDIEVCSALVQMERTHHANATRIQDALTDHLELPLQRHGHVALLPRLLELRHNFSIYDAVYVALSESLNAALLTADNRLARAVRHHTAVELWSG